jgi:pyruvate/2-oxoglutarate dehydrogenase complex dihydrolipoamide acyltransferase (E2) component
VPTARLALVAVGLVAAVALFLLVRPGGDDEPAVQPATTAPAETETAETEAETGTAPAATTAEPAETETEPAQTAPDPDAPVNVRLTFIDGRVQGGIQRPSVRQGRLVRIVVRADVADHVHLHGYDVMRNVAPGAPAQLQFRADIPGIFEIELEDRGIHLADLEVRP